MRRIWNLPVPALLILLLSGCYEKGDGLSASQQTFADPQQVQGVAALPAAGGAYALLTLSGEFGLGGDGSFQAEIPANFPSLALVLDEQDRILLLGFLTPGQDPQALDATTTAVALLYFALGGFTLPGTELQAFLDLVENDPATQPVVDLIEADPQALANGDPSLLAALAAARRALLGVPGLQSAALELAGRRSLQTNAVTPGRIHLEPDKVQSNVEMATQPGGMVFARNHIPRRGVLLAYRTEVIGLDGTTQDIDPPLLVAETPLAITNHPSSSLLESIDALLIQDNPWVPQPSDPIELPLDAGAASVGYQLVVLGASFGNGGPILAEPRFGPYLPDWTQRLDRLRQETLVAEFLVPLLASEAFGSSYSLRGDAQPATVSRILELAGPTLDPFALHTPGGFQGGLRAVIETAAADPVLGKALLREISRGLAARRPDGSTVNLLHSILHPVDWDKVVGTALRTLQAMVATGTVLDAIDLALGDTDMGGRLQALEDNRPAESWTAAVGRVSITPETAVVAKNAPIVTLRARVVTEGLANPSFRYHWHTPGTSGTLVAVQGDGTDFETSETDVDYVADIGSIFNGELDTVTVEVKFQGVVIGEATATVKGEAQPDNPCPGFPAGDYRSPYMDVSVSPNLVNSGDLVTVAFTYDFANPDAPTQGAQSFTVWIPYMDYTADIVVDGQLAPFGQQTTLSSGAIVTSWKLDTHNGLLFDTFSLNGPETLVGYPTGTIIVRIGLPVQASRTTPETHTVLFTLQFVDSAEALCPAQVTTPLKPGNIYWLGPLVTVDFGDSFHYWDPGLPAGFDAAAGLAAFKILPSRH